MVSTTDADDEVRLAVRAVVDGARRGTRFDRMAVLWPTAGPTPEWSSTSSLPPAFRGTAAPAPDRRADGPAGARRPARARSPWSAAASLMALLGDVPARDVRGRPVPSARWERIGRRAGIVRDADWERPPRRAIVDAAGRGPNEVAAATSLTSLVDDLRSALGSPSDVRRWSEWVAWSHERLDWWFGRPGSTASRVSNARPGSARNSCFRRLGHLDSIGPPVTRAEFRATFVAELEVTPARHGKVGDGVHVGALSGAGGLDVDLVVMVGAADGLLPPPPAVDPLLGEAERVAAGLVGSEERVDGGASPVPRRRQGPRPDVSSRFPAGTCGRRRTTSRHDGSTAGRAVIRSWTMVHSHAHALASTEFPVSEAEHRRRHLWAHVGRVRMSATSPSRAILDSGLRLRDARAGAGSPSSTGICRRSRRRR